MNWLFRNAFIGGMALGIVAAARDEERRSAGLLALGLGVIAFVTWAVVRVLEKKLFGALGL